MKRIGWIVAVAGLIMAFQNCSPRVSFSDSNDGANSSLAASTGDGGSGANSSSSSSEPGNVSCDPLSGGGSACAAGAGLLGPLFYMRAGQTATAIDTILTQGIRASVQIQMSRFDVPDHNFEDGFMLSDGTLLKDDQGQVLTEFFAMDLSGRLTIGGSYSSGYYQFGLDSDDGSRIYISSQLVVNADEIRSMGTMVVAPQPVFLNAGVSVPFRLQYYQGPRYRLGLKAYMRACANASVSSCNSGWSLIPAEFLSH